MMGMKDIKTLITSGTIILAVALYLIFAPDQAEDTTEITNNTPVELVEEQGQATTNDDQTENSADVQKHQITPELAVEKTGNELVDVEFLNANDGDTFNVEMAGEKQRVRLLMLDTPEMNYNKGEPMPYAEEAKAFTTELLKNANQLQLLFDVGPETDNYERLLAYVFVDGVSLHELLLREGFAAMRYINKPNNTLEQELRAVQTEAQQIEVNIWSHENYNKKDGFHEEVIKN